ncbi:hypothetical protein [Thalassotalea atypica]|uniref:hypothetical protein n=1 Tax=Thalassotalea atypica TaxID=2054316 RepID=UPI002573C726|nr:hypothetical protein [Thalassotalea atypica]
MAVSSRRITMLSTFLTWQEIQLGQLVPLLPQYELTTMDAYALFSNSSYLSQKVRFLIEHLVQHFGDKPY